MYFLVSACLPIQAIGEETVTVGDAQLPIEYDKGYDFDLFPRRRFFLLRCDSSPQRGRFL